MTNPPWISNDEINAFAASLRRNGRTDSTIRAYVSDLVGFQAFVMSVWDANNQKTLEDEVATWLNHHRMEWSPNTTKRRLGTLRSYARWKKLPELLPDYKSPTPAKPEPHPIPEGIGGVLRMIAVAKYRNQRCLVALCGLCGLRVGEALAIRPRDYDAGTATLRVWGKGNKVRVVPVSLTAQEHIRRAIVTSEALGRDTLVGMTDRVARETITRLGYVAGLERTISSHDLRATFATATFNKCKNLRTTQELLGHASSQTTEVYTAVTGDQLREAVEV